MEYAPGASGSAFRVEKGAPLEASRAEDAGTHVRADRRTDGRTDADPAFDLCGFEGRGRAGGSPSPRGRARYCSVAELPTTQKPAFVPELGGEWLERIRSSSLPAERCWDLSEGGIESL